MLCRTDREGYAQICEAIRDADLTESTAALTLPVLGIAGSVDQSTPPALMRELIGLVPGARLTEIDGAGHLPCVEQPEAVTEAIQAFLKEIAA